MDETLAAAEAITAGSGSNLAIALRVLPVGRRQDMRIFYAFCRVVDDLADEPGLSKETRRAGLRLWREALTAGTAVSGEPSLAVALREVFARREVPFELACEIVHGCEMDLAGVRYRTWDELRQYCYRVASAVGLVSARIFGGVGCDRYAEDLGLALQLTNILRDSAEDFSVSGRVYLPLEEMEAFGVKPGEWVTREPRGWADLMRLQANRTRELYSAAVHSLPESQRRGMVAAEIMRAVYGRLFDDMAMDGFRVWERRYRVGRMQKIWLAASVFVGTCLSSSGLSARIRTGL
jgi:phytoene synthase